MSGYVRIGLLLLAGVALGVAYNAWAASGDDILAGTNGGFALLDMISYASGLVVGMVLWQLGSVPWEALPQRAHQYVMSQMQVYQFLLMGAGCLLVLIYF